MKKIVMLLLAFLLSTSCTSGGTEVTNPSDILTYTNATYGFTVTLTTEWSYTEYTDEVQPADDIYTDPLESEEPVVLFEKDETDLLILADTLSSGQTLSDYVALRHTSADVSTATKQEGDESIIVRPDELGSHGGTVIFQYMIWGDYVLIFRIEIVADTQSEIDELEDEFFQITESIETADIVTPNYGMISAGLGHSMFLTSDGTLYAWGWNQRGELGLGIDDETVYTPTVVSGISDLTYILGGNHNSTVLTESGDVYGWGANTLATVDDDVGSDVSSPTLFEVIDNVSLISTGASFNITAGNDGIVRSWGVNFDGRLGDGTTEQRFSPVSVDGLSNITQLSSGGHSGSSAFTMALTSDGAVYVWGEGENGQMADNTDDNSVSPIVVDGLPEIASVDSSLNTALAVTSDGSVYGWGGRDNGQLGGGGSVVDQLTPMLIDGLDDVTAVASGAIHSVALKSDGTVWFAGKFSTSDSEIQTFGELEGIDNVVAIAAGAYHTLFLKNDSTIWGIGMNTWGQLGQDPEVLSESVTPMQITGF